MVMTLSGLLESDGGAHGHVHDGGDGGRRHLVVVSSLSYFFSFLVKHKLVNNGRAACSERW